MAKLSDPRFKRSETRHFACCCIRSWFFTDGRRLFCCICRWWKTFILIVHYTLSTADIWWTLHDLHSSAAVCHSVWLGASHLKLYRLLRQSSLLLCCCWLEELWPYSTFLWVLYGKLKFLGAFSFHNTARRQVGLTAIRGSLMSKRIVLKAVWVLGRVCLTWFSSIQTCRFVVITSRKISIGSH